MSEVTNVGQPGQKKIRFRYFIDKPFQTKFIAKFVSIILLGMLITLAILWYYSQTRYEEGVYMKRQIEIVKTADGKMDTKITKVETFNRLQLFWRPIVYVSLLYIGLIIVFGLFYSHAMAGPLHRIQKDLERALAGEEVTEIKLRKNDHFQNLAALLTKLLQKLQIKDNNADSENKD